MAFEPKEPQKELKYKELRIYSDEELNNYTEESSRTSNVSMIFPIWMNWKKVPGPALWLMQSEKPCIEGNLLRIE